MEDLTDLIKQKTRENAIQCKSALEIADQLDMSPRKVGEEINRLGIKIKGCQLGCFN